MTRSMPARLALVALPLWLLWTVLVVVDGASPEPGTLTTIVFVVSMLAAFIGCCWATWHSLDGQARKVWHRPATLALGGGLFVVMVLVGHFIGVAIAQSTGPG